MLSHHKSKAHSTHAPKCIGDQQPAIQYSGAKGQFLKFVVCEGNKEVFMYAYLTRIPPAEEIYRSGVKRSLREADGHPTKHDASIVVRYLIRYSEPRAHIYGEEGDIRQSVQILFPRESRRCLWIS